MYDDSYIDWIGCFSMEFRRHIFQAQRNFYQWTRLAIEIINHRQYKPEVYFNFVKHILLAGQNLLNTFKLFIRKWQQQQQQQFDHKSSSSSSSSASALLVVVAVEYHFFAILSIQVFVKKNIEKIT